MRKVALVRRPVLAVLAAVSVAALLVGVVTQTSSGATAADGTLVVDTSFVVQTIDPARMFEPTSQIAVKALYDTLLTFTAGGTKPQPWLASSWKASKDAKVFTFKLRRDVRFTDGTPLTSADVVFSFRRIINLKGSPSFLLANTKVSAPDRYTVVLRSSVSNPALLRIVPNPSLGIVNSKLVKAHGGTVAAFSAGTDLGSEFVVRLPLGPADRP